MPTPIAMPKLGMTMREGRVVAWPVAVGTRVEKGAPVVVIESEKAEIEVEATTTGWLRHVYVEPEATVPCGTLLGAIVEDGPDAPFDAEAFRRLHDRPGGTPGALPAGAPPAAATSGPPRAGGGRPVTPAARARARELGVDPGRIPGTGPGGRVTREDVEAFAVRRANLVDVGDGTHLEVLRDGAGPPIVLLPGFGTDVSAFAPQAAVLREHATVIGVHPRGVGGSDGPGAGAYTVATMAADVTAVPWDPAHVVGASLGAAIALEVVLAHPERVRALTLITPFVDATARLRAVTEAWARVAAEASAETLARALLPWLFGERTLAEAGTRERLVRGIATTVASTPATVLARAADAIARWSGTRRDALARVRVPTTVVVAGADLLTPDGAALATAIPGARVVVVPDAGHAVTIEAPEAVTAALRAASPP